MSPSLARQDSRNAALAARGYGWSRGSASTPRVAARWSSLAPVFVVGARAGAGGPHPARPRVRRLLRDSPHKRLIVAGLGRARAALVVLLTYLGVTLPQRRSSPRPGGRVWPRGRDARAPSGLSVPSVFSMSEAWSIGPCPEAECRRLAAELGISRTTASVLVRRGLRDPEEARAFLAGALPGHDPFALGDMRAAVEAIRAAVAARQADLRARRLRRRRHLRDRARGLPAARARRRPCLAPAVALRGGLRAARPDARPARRARGSSSCSPSTAASRRSPRSRRPGGSGSRSSSPTTTVPSERFPDCPVVAPLKGDYPFAGLCGTASSGSSPRRCSAQSHPFLRPPPRHRRARDRRRRRPAPRREPRARASRPAPARPDPEARPAGADGGRRASIRPPATRARSASGSRRGSTPPGGSAGRALRSTSC